MSIGLFRKLVKHTGKHWDAICAELLKADCDKLIAKILDKYVEQNACPQMGFVFRGKDELSNGELFISPSGRLLRYETMPWPKPSNEHSHDAHIVQPNAKLIAELMPGEQYARLRTRTLLKYRNCKIARAEFEAICSKLIALTKQRVELYA